MRIKVLWAAAMLSLGGCNCLEPVAEEKDGGGRLDAGRSDAGDAGPAPACTTAAQCQGAFPAQSLCSFGGDAGFSCIDQRCVFECSRGRACTFDAGPACLDCSSGTSCVEPACGAASLQGQVEAVTTGCQVGFTDVMLQPTGGCRWLVADATGTKGVVTRLGSGVYVGTFPNLGTCVGMSTFSQVERALFSCEGCQFVLQL